MFQSGFRRKFSTETCLVHLSDYIRFEMDKGHLVGMVLLDLQKAFDTVDHSILLMKLEAIGLGDDILRWFRSYLSDRQQLVDLSGTFSKPCSVTCGVPQGSILGPLLFLIYVNDMSGAINSKLLLYADDSGILVAGKNRSFIEKQLSEDLELVHQWLVDNRLSLHLGKTESILFGSKVKVNNYGDLCISCSDKAIQSTSSVKYLGAILDQNLSGQSMVSSIIKKANARLKFLYRKQKYLTVHTKKLLVQSLIQCHFDYACCAWYSGLTKLWKNKLQVTQNKLIRFVLNMEKRSHIDQGHFRSIGWLPVDKRVDQIILGHVFKIRNGLSPEYMNQNFVSQVSIHTYSTRSSDNGSYILPKVKGFGIKSFSFLGCKLWNSLPLKIRNLSSLASFKKTVKCHFLTNLD